MVTHVRLRGVLPDARAGAPSILQRTDQGFVPAVLAELSRKDNEALESTRAGTRDSNGVLKLYMPVQRTFNVALLDASCDTFGEPRLAAGAIEGTGLVLRRLSVDAEGRTVPGAYEGWCEAGNVLRGWVALAPDEQEQDPDPSRRRPLLSAGNAAIDELLSLRYGVIEPLAESVGTLFPAPPAVCRQSGRTVLYGMVPLVSAETSETPDADAGESVYTSPEMRQKLIEHLSGYLRAGRTSAVPRAGQRAFAADANAPDLTPVLTLLRQAAIEFDAFGDSAESASMLQALDSIELSYPDGSTSGAGQFCRTATRVLLEMNDPAGEGVVMPESWPVLSEAQGEAIVFAMQASLTAQRQSVKPHEGRFDAVDRQYAIRAFVRVRRDDGCPPDLVWSDYSEPFTIAPWYEPGDATPVQISLPDLTNREALKRLKPNVVFAVPENLQRILTQNSAKDLADGNGSAGSGTLGIDWLCSFSIPIITLCAFIVLNVFLSLLNIIFNWMLFLKICIPIPRRN